MNESNETQTLTVVGYEDGAGTDRGLFTRQVVRKVVDVQKLEQEVQSFLAAMEQIIGRLNHKVAEYTMDSVTVSAEVSAKGNVSLLGTGGEIGGKGGISFTFKRLPS
jgi:hypothetical protein